MKEDTENFDGLTINFLEHLGSQIEDRKRLQVIITKFTFERHTFFQLADAELWEDLIRVAQDISQSPDKDPGQLLRQDFICGKKWPTKRVHLRSEDWHQIPCKYNSGTF